MPQQVITALLSEDRQFAPADTFNASANVKDEHIYQWAAEDREGFWASMAERLDWFHKWDSVLEWDLPFAKWFAGGKLNVSVNCIDRHLKTWRRNKAAIIWEGEPGDQQVLTFHELYRKVNKCAHTLRKLGVEKGDRITIYLPMIPELPIAMLACARIGAIHSVVFGGFSAESLRDRINDSQSKIVITSDGGYRRGSVIKLKQNVDKALEETTIVEKVLVVKRVGDALDVAFQSGRDFWWEELMEDAPAYAEPEIMDSEDPLFILYTSGSTGKPKGVLHTTGGYLTGVAATHHMVFDVKEEDTYWCTADIGWITGHSYIVYGPLANGTTTLMYEGTPDYPQRDRFWSIIEKYGVSILYTAPTAIRTFMRWGTEWPERHDLSSLRLLGSVGEPINPEAWMWYHKHIGREQAPIVDTWWQTETGMIMITSLPGVVNTKPGSAAFPFPGVEAEVVDERGKPVSPGQGGYLVIKSPWPAMLRTIYGAPDRYKKEYWSRFSGVYFTGDGARVDTDGYFWLLGRVDDVINVSGHRIGTMEIESALVDHKAVAEAAVIGTAHEIKGQAVTAFVTLKEGVTGEPQLVDELKGHVVKKIGAVARPEEIFFVVELPKTRSGKIMRRLLRDIAEGRALGDTTTLADPSVMSKLKEIYQD